MNLLSFNHKTNSLMSEELYCHKKIVHSVDDDIKNPSLNRRNSAPPVLDYDDRVV